MRRRQAWLINAACLVMALALLIADAVLLVANSCLSTLLAETTCRLHRGWATFVWIIALPILATATVACGRWLTRGPASREPDGSG